MSKLNIEHRQWSNIAYKPEMANVWKNFGKFIKPCDIVPGHRIMFYVNRWHGMYQMQVAKVELQDNGSVKIKAGMCGYTFWTCYLHTLVANEKVWLLGSNEDGTPIELIK